MNDIEVLIVGDGPRAATGGIARYVDEQLARLGERTRVELHDIGTSSATRTRFVLAALLTAVGFLRFPFRSPPDVVHVHSSHRNSFYRASFYVLFAAAVWRRPVVLHIHGSSFDEFARSESTAVRALQSLVFGASDAVVVLSEYWADVLSERLPPEKLVVVPNAVDHREYEPTFERDVPTLVFVSNLIRRKGIGEFVEAVDRLERRGIEFRVRIAGAGPYAEAVEELAARHPGVEYLGYVSEAEKRRMIERGTIYVLPTHAEGLPIALLEGMAGGNAVVTTHVGSIPEVVGRENGRVIDPGDVDELVEALGELLDDPASVAEMGRRNRDLVVERYSWPTITDRLVALYEELADDGAPTGCSDRPRDR